MYDVLDAKDCYDLNYSLYKPEVACELISTLSMRYSACNMASHYCNNVFYCDQCNNSDNLFGCIGLNHAKYCILNKQYSEEEYNVMVPRIKEHMRSTNIATSSKNGDWGEFFPGSINPFGYNETVAQEYYPLKKELAANKGYGWRDETKKEYAGATVSIPDNIADVGLDLAGKTLKCDTSGKHYKLIEVEIELYKKLGVPAPHRSPEQRHLDRMALRSPRMLWPSKCSKCGSDIHTSYPPGREEKVYCEKCYQAEVY